MCQDRLLINGVFGLKQEGQPFQPDINLAAWIDARIYARLDAFETRMDARFQGVDARFQVLESRMKAVEDKLDSFIEEMREWRVSVNQLLAQLLARKDADA
jgi:hypothetical protein